MKHERKLLRVGGEDRVGFLNDLLTIAVSADMGLRYGALLTPQGKLLSDLFIWGEKDTLMLDLPSSAFAAMVQRLTLYRLRADVRFAEDGREIWQVLSGGVDDPRGAVAQRFYGTNPDEPVGAAGYLRARIAAVVPEFGIDFGADEIFPIEWRFREMGGIDYRKGCYVGQEIAARMRYKTELNKSVLPVRVEGQAATGAAITVDDRPVGKLLSQTGDQAMAFLRLKSLGGALMADGACVTPIDDALSAAQTPGL